MLASFFESIKYVGHLWPVALVRVLLGYHYLSTAMFRLQKGYIEHAYISEQLNLSEDHLMASGLYFEIFKGLIQSQWLVMTYVLIATEFLIGFSYILGLGVRLTSLLGLLLSLHVYLYFELVVGAGQIYLLFIHLLFFLLGAGRCLGLDYYFYKSRRGLFW